MRAAASAGPLGAAWVACVVSVMRSSESLCLWVTVRAVI
jgi:hypothetical protein